MRRALLVLLAVLAVSGCASLSTEETKAPTELELLSRSAQLAFSRGHYAQAATLYQATLDRALIEDRPEAIIDGQRVIMSLQQDGNANIYTMDLRSRTTTRLTNTAAIDTAPSYSPDGSQIAFESDRGGRQQIYVMGADGSGQRRISFGDGSYSTPVWSPRGDLIAFTKQSGGKFSIGVMKTDGSGERILTTGFHNEGPTWAPNGRVLMFFRQNAGAGGPQLYSIDLSGYNEQAIPTQGFASDPAWSPLLE